MGVGHGVAVVVAVVEPSRVVRSKYWLRTSERRKKRKGRWSVRLSSIKQGMTKLQCYRHENYCSHVCESFHQIIHYVLDTTNNKNNQTKERTKDKFTSILLCQYRTAWLASKVTFILIVT